MTWGRAGLTRYFVADKVAEKCEGIVERWANILGTCGLEADRGIDAARFAIDVCRYEVICNMSGPLNGMKYTTPFSFLLEERSRQVQVLE